MKDYKDDFPIFRAHPELVYLDSAATSQKPQAVIDAVTGFYTQHNASVHRGLYDLSEQATDLFEAARGKVARFVGAARPEEIIITTNTNTAINLAAYGWGRQHLKQGDIVVLSVMEHHSNVVPWQRLGDELGVELHFLPIDENYRLDYKKTEDLDISRVKLLALTHASNVLGTVNPVEEIAAYFRERGAVAKLLVDAAQSAPHMSLDVTKLGADFLAFSSHKLFGPSGVGILYGRAELLDQMEPLLVGSHMISSVDQKKARWAGLPDKFEPGSPSMEGVVGLGAAIDYIERIGWPAIIAHEQQLTAYGLERFKAEDKVQLFGPPDIANRLGIFSFAIPGVHAHDAAEILNRQHVAVRAGHHCAQPLMRALGVSGTARASVQLYSSKADIDALFDAIREAKRVFGV